ncbi:fibrillin-1-like [Watersipora subatra]|uniref:fibrillin-1-like n=1 Tax=Watersipora subatra TaxID=2589382 RepID=UPI00355B6B39
MASPIYTDIDECTTRKPCNGVNSTCINTPGSFECQCLVGYAGDGVLTCVDVDECQMNVCGVVNATCTNLPGSFKCDCPEGYLSAGKEGCFDGRTPCPDKSNICSLDGQCSYNVGTKSFNCSCKAGFKGDGKTCHDINECTDKPNLCINNNSTCVNTHGSYYCTCPSGFTPDGTKGCKGSFVLEVKYRLELERDQGMQGRARLRVNNDGQDRVWPDIDECSSANSPCQGVNAVCLNTAGSYSCECRNGFSGDPFTGCTDINECLSKTACQGDNVTCINHQGTFGCRCGAGFENDGPRKCIDINECLSKTACQGDNVMCVNHQGTFECRCDAGFENDGPRKCKDINECQNSPCKDPGSTCENTPGSYICHCPPGEMYDQHGGTCKEAVILCPLKTHICSVYANCIILPDTTFECKCNEGFLGDGYNCTDIDECAATTPVCTGESLRCSNTLGSYRCECPKGYKNDGPMRCIDIDECQNTPCKDPGSTCENIPGSYICHCLPGEMYNEHSGTCKEAVILCPDKNHKCSVYANCIVLPDASFECKCNEGFKGDGYNCTDIDECAAITPVCSGENVTCSNTLGAYRCTCPKGYENDGPIRCIDIDECQNTPCKDPGSTCENTPGSYICHCPPGEMYDEHSGTCKEAVILCPDKTHICSVYANCIVLPDATFECKCNEGFKGDGYNCTDIDECRATTPVCYGENLTCSNTLGSYICECPKGYKKDGPMRCIDVDECSANMSPCKGTNSICDNTVGSFTCKCPPGYNGDGVNTCKITNKRIPCPDDTHRCSFDARCEVKGTDFSCMCNQGFSGNGYNCKDINECITNPTSCTGVNTTCTNNIGGFTCNCAPGFIADGPFHCTDFDECRSKVSPCKEANSTCTNTVGSFICQCPPGYTGDGVNNCKDINECQNSPCKDPGSTCENTPGSYICHCPPGKMYDEHGGTCKDVNECKQSISPCKGKNATCINTDGSFTCTCPQGFTGDGVTNCTDIDECKQSSSPCKGENATCTNTDGSFTCACPKGFNGDGVTKCTSLDSCSSSPCKVANSRCENFKGGFRCHCPEGYISNPVEGCKVLSIFFQRLEEVQRKFGELWGALLKQHNLLSQLSKGVQQLQGQSSTPKKNRPDSRSSFAGDVEKGQQRLEELSK